MHLNGSVTGFPGRRRVACGCLLLRIGICQLHRVAKCTLRVLQHCSASIIQFCAVQKRGRRVSLKNRIVYRELSSLEKDLQINARMLYSISNNLSGHYKSVPIPKRNGGVRELKIPDGFLKCVQRRINNTLLFDMPVSPYASAYRTGVSPIKNAKPHIKKDWVVKLDIYKFFDSIMYSTVKEKVFPASVYSEKIRILLTMLCYYEDSLPQGAPTSPSISNIILYDFDMRVGERCRKMNIAYTRYCDDMTFSGNGEMPDIVACIRDELRKEHLFLNEAKTVKAKRGMKQEVTGIVVNDKINISRDYKRKIRQEIYFIKKFGVENHIKRSGLTVNRSDYLRSLLGRVNYVLSVTPYDREMAEYSAFIKRRFNEC